MKTAEEAYKQWVKSLSITEQAYITIKRTYIDAFESGKAEGFESRQGEVDALIAEIDRLRDQIRRNENT